MDAPSWRYTSGLGAVALLAAAAILVASEDLIPRLANDHLMVSAPRLRLLSGKPLERLRNGQPVSFDFQLSVAEPGALAPLRRAVERFTFSYDLWEEKFSVVLRRSNRTASHLPAGAAEAWCLDNLQLPVRGLSLDAPVLVRLEVRGQEARDNRPVLAEPGISLTGLIELFSRPARGQQPRWTLETGPLRLGGLTGRAAPGD